ncbi:conserved hypothetical protein [Thiomonas sp. X19]|uniref:DUF58 domain-containing protein n=1 Tax=Thiomonas sp. X19 TaxID=1050370 RepID=UPI000B737DFA|nr:DUF58 domain-containing protein [Thiomonas sp. X19]SCC93993.1 conserved hypothetical protein [Thiomonas sp. X19]
MSGNSFPLLSQILQGLRDQVLSIKRAAVGPPYRPSQTLHLVSAADWAEIAAIARQRQTPTTVGRFARHRNPGEGRSAFTGRGMDYVESRVYQSGDDLRSMHWKLLARTGKPHVKLHVEEHAGSWHGLIDVRGAMVFGTRVRTKAQQAARLGLLAAALQAQESPQTLIACTLWNTSGLHCRQFGRGIVAVRRLAAWLMTEPLHAPAPGASPRVDDADVAKRDFIAWVQRLRAGRTMPTHAMLISDWTWIDAATASALWPIAAAAEVLSLRVRDPVEIQLPNLPRSWFVDSTSGKAGWMLPGVRARQCFNDSAERHAQARAQAMRRSGIRLTDVLSSSDALDAWRAVGASLAPSLAETSSTPPGAPAHTVHRASQS